MDVWGRFWELMDKASQVVGVFGIAPVLGTLWLVWGTERRRRGELRTIRETPGSRPAVLIVDVGEGSIRPAVENWLRQQQGFQDFPPDRIHHLDHPDQRLEPGQIDIFMDRFRKIEREIMAGGCDKIHLFLRVPGIVAAMIGAELSNRTAVILYHKNPNRSDYENWGPLHR